MSPAVPCAARHADRPRRRPHVHLALRVPHDDSERQRGPAADRERCVCPRAVFLSSGLMPPAARLAGAVTDARWAHFTSTRAELARITDALAAVVHSPQGWARHGVAVQHDGVRRSALAVLGQHAGAPPSALAAAVPALAGADPALLARVRVDGKYAAHAARQAADVRAFLRDEHLLLDPALDYGAVDGLSSEARERLSRLRPASIGAAKRMEGVTPTSVLYLLKYAKRTHRGPRSESGGGEEVVVEEAREAAAAA